MTRHHFAGALFALAAAVPASAASITPLPGSTPQHTAIGQPFPNPIGVTVLDDSGHPRVGVPVRWTVPVGFLGETGIVVSQSGCFFDVGLRICDLPTDAQGISLLQGVSGTRATTVTVGAATLEYPGVRTALELTIDPAITPISITSASGSGQRTPIGTALANPFVVRILKPDGTPAQSVPVTFVVTSGNSEPTGTFPLQSPIGSQAWSTTTDSDGYAHSALFTVRWGIGTGTVRADAWDADARAFVSTTFTFVVTNLRGGDTMSFQGMWWGGPDQSGWGVSIAQHGDKLFPIVFGYGAGGKPEWWVLSDGDWVLGVGGRFLGWAHRPRGAPWFDYDTDRFEPGPAGIMALEFQGEERGAIQLSLPPPATGGVTKRLERFDFSRDDTTPLHGVGDMWWGGPEQSGWGVSIMEKPGGLFSMWFTYDANGDATWFVMPDGAWTSSDTYEGRMYRTTGSPWFTGAYDASQFRATEVGPYRLRFLDANRAKLEYNVDGRTGILDLVRFDFD